MLMKRLFVIILFLAVAFSGIASFVKISPAGKYFEHNGRAIVPVGFNDAITWPSLISLSYGNKEAAEEYFEKLSYYGVNTLRIMFEYAQDRSGLSLFESPLGTYNDTVIGIWDNIISLAEKYNIYLIITPWDPFWMYENWDVNPYNTDNGGPISTMAEFLTDEEALEWQKARFRFMIERYGASEQILAWELNNEIELWYGHIFYKADYSVGNEARKWIEEISTFIRALERDLYGETHLLTVSTAKPALTGILSGKLYRFDHIDFFTTHFYFDTIKDPKDPIKIAEDVVMNINYHNYLFNDSIPFMDSESGPIDRWPQPSRFDTACYKAFSWAHLASGGTGIGMRWPYTSPHLMPDYLLQVLKPISQFIESEGIDWLDFSGINLDNEIIVSSDKDIFHTCSGNSLENLTSVIGWVASKETIGNVVIESSALDEGTYLLEIWSDRYERDIDSYILGSYEFDSKEDFSLQLSIDQSSFAYKIYRIES